MTPVRIRPEAETEAFEAAQYYNSQAIHLGFDFLLELDEAIGRITHYPEAYEVLYNGVRRAPLRRFPYGAFYLLEGGEVVVFAVLHLSRDPETWKLRSTKG